MNDKLDALRKISPIVKEEYSTEIDHSSSEDTPELTGEDHIQIESKHLNELCDNLEYNINIIEDIYKKHVSSGVSSSYSISKNQQLEALKHETNTLANNIRNHLKHMKTESEVVIEDSKSMFRMKQNIRSCISKRFVDIMQKYQHIQIHFHKECENNYARQINIIQQQGTEETIDELQLVQLQLVDGDRQKQQDKASISLIMIKEQHAEIVRLEQDIAELYQIFVDMSNLIDAQDEIVNNIVRNIEKSEVWIGDAVHNQLPKAREYKTKERKKCCALCMSCGALFTAAAGGIALGLAPLAACSIQ